MGPYGTISDHTGPGVHISSNRRGIVKESQIDLSVREGVREGGRERVREFVGYCRAYAPKNILLFRGAQPF